MKLLRVLIVLASGSAAALLGEQLPSVPAETLAGQAMELRAALKGHPALLCIGFSHASQTQTMQWDREASKQIAGASKVDVYSVAVLEGAPRLIRGMIIHAIKGSVPPERQSHFLVVVHNSDDLKRAAGFKQEDDAYVLLLDSSGDVKWKTHGAAAPGLLDELAAQVRGLR